MSRLQSIVLTIAALTIAGGSFMPPWVEVVPIRGSSGSRSNPAETARLVVTYPLGSYLLFAPPRTDRGRPFGHVDYGRLALYYLGTIVLVVPFFVWRRRTVSIPERLQEAE
ncbi:hypothetical protein LCGC14_1585640 [marine sediment metagenome]|uniref:Uncharacterized protein n=1 Tax=marine sediment metagenome TaxID=412755 RepID=A0A0F9IFJ7_9ZZZZ